MEKSETAPLMVAAVVWYHPSDHDRRHSMELAPLVPRLIIIDNTPEPSYRKPEASNLTYASAGLNQGMARALNQAHEIAEQLGATWLLSLDQDSRLSTESLRRLERTVGLVNDRSNVGMVVPRCLDGRESPAGGEALLQVGRAITSGAVLRQDVWRSLGGYNDQLFIDGVDIDLCIRLADQGYKILQDPVAVLHHSLGDGKDIELVAGRRLHVTNHNPIRRYYITRNRLFIAFKYYRHPSQAFRGELWRLVTESVKVLIFEPQRWRKICAIARGIWDFMRGRMGPA